MGVLPAVIGSLFFERLSPLFTLAAIAVTYGVMLPAQARLFEFSPKERHWSISVPVHAFFLSWAALLIPGTLYRLPSPLGVPFRISHAMIWILMLIFLFIQAERSRTLKLNHQGEPLRPKL